MNKIIKKLFSKEYLFFTNITIGMTFHTTGDFITQNIEILENPNKKIDFRRLFSMSCGGIFYGICGHVVYSYVDNRYSGHSLSIIRNKLTLDALTCPPIAFIGMIIVGKAEKHSFQYVWTNIKENFLYIMAFDAIFYLPAQIINYRYISPRFRYIFVASTALIYTTYLSYFLHRRERRHP